MVATLTSIHRGEEYHLSVYKDFVPDIVRALQQLVGARTTEVLPNLQIFFMDKLTSFPF
jgi:hypothetical protein